MHKYIVSACLAGIFSRYNGDCKENEAIMVLCRKGLVIPACPEQLGGLPTPRDPGEMTDGRVFTPDGVELTAEYARGAEEALRMAKLCGVTRAVLQPRSPSCGRDQIYDGTFTSTLIPGNGLFAELCLKAGIEVLTPDELAERIENGDI